MRIIDLLNKIANGEEVPKKIKFYGKYYIWYDNRYTGNKGYCLEPLKSDSNSFLEINTVYDLKYEVEILEEENKIEKLENGKWHIEGKDGKLIMLKDKIDELIDEINKSKENK